MLNVITNHPSLAAAFLLEHSRTGLSWNNVNTWGVLPHSMNCLVFIVFQHHLAKIDLLAIVVLNVLLSTLKKHINRSSNNMSNSTSFPLRWAPNSGSQMKSICKRQLNRRKSRLIAWHAHSIRVSPSLQNQEIERALKLIVIDRCK